LQASTTTRDEPEAGAREDEEEGFVAEAATATGFFFLEEEADTADFLPGDLEVRDDCVLAIFSGMYEDGFCEGFIADDSSVFFLLHFTIVKSPALFFRGARSQKPNTEPHPPRPLVALHPPPSQFPPIHFHVDPLKNSHG